MLMLEELDVALPDEIICPVPGRRGRRLVLQDTASLVDRLEAGEDRCIAAFGLQESAQTFDPVFGSDVREVNPEQVVEDGDGRFILPSCNQGSGCFWIDAERGW